VQTSERAPVLRFEKFATGSFTIADVENVLKGEAPYLPASIMQGLRPNHGCILSLKTHPRVRDMFQSGDRLSFAKMLSSLNAFEISNIEKQETDYFNHAIGM
jgi:hypothetical protein